MPRSKKSASVAPVIRLDGRQLTDATAFHTALAKAFGLPKTYGKNLDALVDCLTDLDNPDTALAKASVAPGQVLTVLIDHATALKTTHREWFDALIATIAFVNYRRLESAQGPVLTLAFAD